MTNENRLHLVKKQAKILSEIKLIEKKLTARKPKKEQADRKLAQLKAAAVARVESIHARNTARLTREVKMLTEELALKKKGYLEVSTDILSATNPTPEKVTVPPRTLLSNVPLVPILD